MSPIIPSFAVRSSAGINTYNGPPSYEINSSFKPETSKSCRTMIFSPDGRFFSWCNGVSINIVSTKDWSLVAELPRPKASNIAFSPQGTYFMSWEVFTVSNANPQGTPNVYIYKTDDWQVVTTFLHKKQTNWEIQWSGDETICARMTKDDVVFYENGNLEKIVNRINFAKIGGFSLAPGSAPNHVLCYTPGAQGQPALGRLFKYPKFDSQQSLANKSFFQADKVIFYWNNKGTNALLLTTTEVDKTGASYYGKQTLHYMATNGNSAMIALKKEGPIYSICWSPNSSEFCVVYGFMPSKATIFNLKCEPVFEMGTWPRNSIYYNPQGNLLLLGGFGNLRGQIEMWHIEKRKLLNRFEAPDTTLLEWSPNGIHFLTATTAPRLRIGNGIKIWHYSGSLVYEKAWPENEELYEVQWQNFDGNAFPTPAISSERVQGIQTAQPTASKEAYRPPGARGRAVNFKLHDDEETSTISTSANTLSKASLKQKKKREAKKLKKQEKEESGEISDTEKEKPAGISVNLTGDVEKDKKIKNVKKKLDAILKLKEQQAAGKVLEINQVAKIKGEMDLLKELEVLQI